MIKHTKTIRRPFAEKQFECVDHFVGLALKYFKLQKVIRIQLRFK